MLPSEARIVICGGGISGLSLLWNLAKLGVKDAILIDAFKTGGFCKSLINEGILFRNLWAHAQFRDLTERGIHICKALSSSHSTLGYASCRRLIVADSLNSFSNLKRMYSVAKAFNLNSELLTSSQITSQCKYVSSNNLEGALIIPEATLNPSELVDALIEEIDALSDEACIVENCRVYSVEIDPISKKVFQVHTSEGPIRCQAFVNAGGSLSREIEVISRRDQWGKRPDLAAIPLLHSQLLVECDKNFSSVNSENEPLIMHDISENVWLKSVPGSHSFICGGYHNSAWKTLTPEQCEQLVQKYCYSTTAFCGSKFRDVNDADADNKKLSQGDVDISADATLSDLFDEEIVPDAWDSFFPLLDRLLQRFPILHDAKLHSLRFGPEMVTPDLSPLIGEVHPFLGYWTIGACGGLAPSIGAGSLLAEWILSRDQLRFGFSRDTSAIDSARFLPLHSTEKFLSQRVPEVVAQSFRILRHNAQFYSVRNIRQTPIHSHQARAGAVFGELMGIERPLFFGDPDDPPVNASQLQQPLLGSPLWHRYVAREYDACRRTVGMVDMSSFSKFEVYGPEKSLVPFLQRVMCGNVDTAEGTCVYTAMLNEDGGYVSDCTVTRLSPDSYFIIGPTVQQFRSIRWLNQHKPDDVVVHDVTSLYTGLNIMGPSSKHLLADVCGRKFDPQDFPAFHCRPIDINCASGIRALSVSHAGELGWVLYIPNELAQHVYLTLIAAGKAHGLQLAGYFALRNLRIEKFFIYWGMDIEQSTTPLECGRAYRVSFDKDFIGKDALLRKTKEGIGRRYIQLLLKDHDLNNDPWPVGQEPIYRNDVFCGWTTSFGYGYTLQQNVCLGYVWNPQDKLVNIGWLSEKNAIYTVDVAGQRFECKINLHSPNLPMPSSEHPSHYRPTQEATA